MKNAGKFSAMTFDEFGEAQGIDVEHPIVHVHTQNGLAESLIKRMQVVARGLLMCSKLPTFTWGHTVLHANTLIRLHPTMINTFPLYS